MVISFKAQDETSTGDVVRCVGLILLLTLAYTFIGSALFYLFGISVVGIMFPSAMLLAALTGFLFFRTPIIVVSSLATILLTCLTLLISSVVPDYSFDGNFYHQEIIEALCRGWNPYLDTMGFPDLQIWDYHYAKALEIISADIVGITGVLESGKAANFLLMEGTFFTGFYVFRYILGVRKIRMCLAFCLLLVLNPVFVCQAFTYYIDFAAYFYLVNTIFASVAIASDRDKVWAYIILDMMIVLAIGTKFNSFFIEGVAIICIVVGFCIYGQKHLVKKYLINILVVGLVGAFIVSFHPYVTNLMLEGNPFYPLLGSGARDIMTASTPDLFDNSNRIINFFKSIYSVAPPSFDSRIAGFGPLFGLIFACCLLVLIITIYKDRRLSPVNYMSICVIASCFIFEQSWWARYIAQLWILIPACYYSLISSDLRKRGIFRYTFLSLVFINVAICAGNAWRMAGMVKVERSAIFQVMKGQSVELFNSKIQWKRQLEENGISVVDNRPSDVSQGDTVYFYYGVASGRIKYPYMITDRQSRDAIDSLTRNSIYHRISHKIKNR